MGAIVKRDIFGFSFDAAWDYENGFYLTSHVTRIAKLLAHFELYKTIVGLPGHVIECGVYKGASLIRFATFREILESPFSRRIIAFDAFGAFPVPPDPEDAQFAKDFEAAGGHGISVEELELVLARKQLENTELVPGDICQTVPNYLMDHPELKVALLHIDVDVFEPTSVVLDSLFDRVVRGGVVVLDDYGTVGGETRAVDQFLEGRDITIEKLPLSHVPAFVRIN